MAHMRPRIWAIGLAAALIAGCGGGAGTTGGGGSGGGGGGGGSTPTTVTLTFPSGTTLAAAQIGSGAFTTQTLSANKLSLSIPSGTNNYAVAYICPVAASYQGQLTEEAVWEASIADGTSVNLSCMYTAVSTAGTGTLTGNLDASAIAGVQSFTYGVQNGSSFLAGGSNVSPTGNFSTLGPTGSDRVLVLANGSASQGALAAKNFTNQAVPGALNSGNTVVFGTADETMQQTITYNSVPSGFSSPSTSIGFEMAGAPFGVSDIQQATTQYPMLPAAATESGDSYYFEASSFLTSGNNLFDVFTEALNTGGPQSFTFPAAWSYAGPTASAQPAFNMGYTGFAGKSGVLEEATYYWQTGTSGTTPLLDEISLSATTTYQGGSSALTVPNLSGLSGFLPAPASGSGVTWFAQVWQFSFGVEGTATAGSTGSGVLTQSNFTVP